MTLRVKLMPENRVMELDLRKARVREILRTVGLPQEMAVVLRNGRIVTGEEMVEEGDDIVVMRAVSGG